jgi:hypothetical protein
VVSAAPVGTRPHAALGEMLVRCGQLTRERADQLYRECDAGAQLLPRLAVARDWISQSELEQIEDLLTRETFFTVLRWTAGTFRFVARDVEHPRRFGELLGAEQILMDGLRMMDEWQSIAELVPSEDLVHLFFGPPLEHVLSSQVPRPLVQAPPHLFSPRPVPTTHASASKIGRFVEPAVPLERGAVD